MSRLPAFLVLACLAVPAFAAVPEQYTGTWILDLEATQGAIDKDPEKSEERKAQERSRFTRLKEAEVTISEDDIEFRGFSARPYLVAVTLQEQSSEHTLLSGVMTDPYNKKTMELSFELHLNDDEELNFKMLPGGDLDPAIWKRGESGANGGAGEGPGGLIGYLDSLKTCSPGEFRFSYPGFGTYDNKIVGPDDDHCQVEIEHPQIRMTCNYSDTMIALLTSEQKYEDARNGVLRGSTDSEESKLMGEECSVR